MNSKINLNKNFMKLNFHVIFLIFFKLNKKHEVAEETPPSSGYSSENSSSNLDEQSGADVMREFLRNGMTNKIKKLQEEAEASSNRRDSITQDDIISGIDSPVRGVSKENVLEKKVPEKQKRS